MNCLDRVLRPHLLRLAVAAFVIAPAAPVLAANCAQWNVGGTHYLRQSNMVSSGLGSGVTMTLQQDGTLFKGSMSFGYRNGDLDVWIDKTGDVVGSVVGNKFEATVYWEDNGLGIYSGEIGPQGLVVGRTFNKNRPSDSADFHGTPAFDCLPASAQNAAAGSGNSGKPAIALGRTNAPAPPPVKVSQLPAGADKPLAALNPQLLAPKAPAGAAASATGPSIVEPRPNGTYPQQTPLRVRVVSGKDAKDTAYRIEIQLRENMLIWHDVATVNTPASVAQSPQGYVAWGGGPGGGAGSMTAMPGVYRVRATSTTPGTGQPGEWVQFKIDGLPVSQADATTQPKPEQGKTGGAAQPPSSNAGAQPGIPNALVSAPALGVQNKAGAASLNPQPLPPKASPGAVTLNPQTLAPKSLSGAASLNPQPLPPAGLQQAPSSMR